MKKNNVITIRDFCSGCGACAQVCPKKCIEIKRNLKGELKSFVANKKCIECGLCINICHIQSKKLEKPIAIFGGYSLDEYILQTSRSGGIFAVLANSVLSDGGAVYGAAILDNLTVEHIRITNHCDLLKLQGSKYVQSYISPQIYLNLLNDIKNKKFVLFSGTPCQVSAIKTYLNFHKISKDRYLLVDIICHSTPTYNLYKSYLRYIGFKGRVLCFDFRDKTKGWGNHIESYILDKKGKFTSTIYRELFYSSKYNTRNCFNCQYTSIERCSDITLGDFWGIEKKYKEKYNKKGNSLIICMSDMGLFYINKIRNLLYLYNIDLYDNSIIQLPLMKPISKPKYYNLSNVLLTAFGPIYICVFNLKIKIKRFVHNIRKKMIIRTK